MSVTVPVGLNTLFWHLLRTHTVSYQKSYMYILPLSQRALSGSGQVRVPWCHRSRPTPPTTGRHRRLRGAPKALPELSVGVAGAVEVDERDASLSTLATGLTEVEGVQFSPVNVRRWAVGRVRAGAAAVRAAVPPIDPPPLSPICMHTNLRKRNIHACIMAAAEQSSQTGGGGIKH